MPNMVNIVRRSFNLDAANGLAKEGVIPILARVLAARGITDAMQLDVSLAKLIPPEQLTNAPQMAVLLADAIAQKLSLLVVGDYDCDGATATAVAIRGLRSMGAQVEYLVPNRFEYGYGLTPEIVELAAKTKPDMIITVDNGIASVDGVAKANSLGIKVLVTDHHLPGDEKPDAACMVNPNQHGCHFTSKNLAGVGVIFYVMLALRAELRVRGIFANKPEPNLTELLDIVALGTVADLVKLDDNNRILVEQGLRRIRAGKACPAIRALLKLAGRDASKANAQDLGFSVGPRINAAGRLDDMALGIACLISDDETEATAMAQRLHAMNVERRVIEAEMQEAANISLEEVDVGGQYSLSIFEPDWHQGVIGILASRIKDQLHRPVIAFAPAGADIIKGSARSIVGVHVRDVLSDIAAAYPKLLSKFGGHAMAAGLTISMHDYPTFALAFDEMVTKRLDGVDLEQKILSDGELTEVETTLEIAELIQNGATWGQDFPEPVFDGVFDVIQVRIVGQRHLKFVLRRPNAHTMIDAIAFFADKPEHWLGLRQIRAAYKLDINEYKGNRSVQFIVHYFEKLA